MARVQSLNHPNVCTLHDVGSNYPVMEFVLKPGNILVNADGAVKDESGIES